MPLLNIKMQCSADPAMMIKSFASACASGDLDFAKKMTSTLNLHQTLNSSDSRTIFALAFKQACLNRQLEVMKWLYEMNCDGTNNTNCDDRELRVELYGEDYEYLYSDMFILLCQRGYLQEAQWLCPIVSKYFPKLLDGRIFEYDDMTEPWKMITWFESLNNLYTIRIFPKEIIFRAKL